MSENMVNALNKQVEIECYSSFLYLAMASWCQQEGLEGCAKFLYRQSDEERMHMMKIFDYILEMDKNAIVPGIDRPPTDFESVRTMFDGVFSHEKMVTESIYKLVNMALEEGDFSTQNFLQWYVEEQREEEALARDILTKIQLIGEGPMSLYYIDKELEQISSNVQET